MIELSKEKKRWGICVRGIANVYMVWLKAGLFMHSAIYREIRSRKYQSSERIFWYGAGVSLGSFMHDLSIGIAHDLYRRRIDAQGTVVLLLVS